MYYQAFMVDLAWSCDVLLRFRDGEDAVLSLVVVFWPVGMLCICYDEFLFPWYGWKVYLLFYLFWSVRTYKIAMNCYVMAVSILLFAYGVCVLSTTFLCIWNENFLFSQMQVFFLYSYWVCVKQFRANSLWRLVWCSLSTWCWFWFILCWGWEFQSCKIK